MKPRLETISKTIRPDEDVLLRAFSKSVELQMTWSESTCADDPDALGLYLPAARQIIVNLRNVYRDAVRMTPEPEGSMIGTLIHLHDMCLIHELIHWATGGSDHHDNWNPLLLEGLIIPMCEEWHRAVAAQARVRRSNMEY